MAIVLEKAESYVSPRVLEPTRLYWVKFVQIPANFYLVTADDIPGLKI
jgi:hypothetical protein